MSTPLHHPLNTATHAGLSLPLPPAARQDAGALQNILQLPVQIIDGWPVFDCRTGKDEFAGQVMAPWGETLYGCERAAYSIGLRVGYGKHDTTPLSISGCPDLRTWPVQFERVAMDLVKHAARLLRDYEEALAAPAPEGEGGSVFYRPVAISVANFGGSLIADRRERAVRRFFHVAANSI